MTTPSLQWASTRHIQAQYDNTQWLLRDIRDCHLQYANIPWASTKPIQGERDCCHIRYVDLQYIHEVYQGPTWLGQPKYDPPTLHWVYTNVYPGPTWLPYTKRRPSIHTRDISRTNVTAICHIRNAHLLYIHEIYPDTDVTAICHIRCANPSMSF